MNHLLAFSLFKMIDIELSMQMIILMLYDSCQKPVCIDVEEFSFDILSLDRDAQWPYDIVVNARNGKTALFINTSLHAGPCNFRI